MVKHTQTIRRLTILSGWRLKIKSELIPPQIKQKMFPSWSTDK